MHHADAFLNNVVAEASTGPRNESDNERVNDEPDLAQSDVNLNRVSQLLEENLTPFEQIACLRTLAKYRLSRGNRRDRGQCSRSIIDLIYGATSAKIQKRFDMNWHCSRQLLDVVRSGVTTCRCIHFV